MRFVALVSGGKDSLHAIDCLCREGHVPVALLHLYSTAEYTDSYMYQTVGSEVAVLLGKCLRLPLHIHETSAHAVNQALEYTSTEGDEVEDLWRALIAVRRTVEYDAVCAGAILSTYQLNRVAAVCKRLGVDALAPLWRREQRALLVEMIERGLHARVVKVASPVLSCECVGMSLPELLAHLDRVAETPAGRELHYCGEGGEYETVVFDGPLFSRRIDGVLGAVQPHPDEVGKRGCTFYGEFIDLRVIEKGED